MAAAEAKAEQDERDRKIPWHFWLILTLVTLYLGWRVIQGVVWVVT